MSVMAYKKFFVVLLRFVSTKHNLCETTFVSYISDKTKIGPDNPKLKPSETFLILYNK